jgi:transketolase
VAPTTARARLAESGLDHFNEDGSTVEMIGAEHSPGVETTTGSLAQALSQAGGMALARKRRGDTGDVWVMMSDGEFQEGQTWEAVEALARFGLDNVRVIVDVNGQQCDGVLEPVATQASLAARLEAFGASAVQVDGHDLDALEEAMTRRTGRPHVVVAITNPVQGLPLFAERAPALHYLRFSSADERSRYEAAYAEVAPLWSAAAEGMVR